MDPLIDLPARFNVAEHLFLPRLEAGTGHQPYLRCGAAELTVATAHAAADRVAFALRRLGLRPGQRVALVLRESLDFPACFWGAVRAGVLPVPLNTVLTPADYRYYLEDSGARALVVDAALWERLAPALEGLRTPPRVVIAGPPDAAPPGHPTLAELLAELPDPLPGRFPVHRGAPGSPAFWLYTSGTTGRPKAAVHAHQDMAHVVATYPRNVLPIAPGELTYSAPKMFFAYGMGNSLYLPLAAGSTALVSPEPATPREAFTLLERHRPSVFYAVPTLLNGMLRLHDAWREGRDDPPTHLPVLSYLRLACSAGEPLPPSLLAGWRERFGVTVLDGIGSTEALHFYLSNRPDDVRPGSTGRAVPGYDLRVVTPEGTDAPDGTPGELWLRGGSVARRYWNKPAIGRRAFQDGWLRTGDRFRRDAEGWYYHEGRVDDLLKIGGSWVNPLEIEHALLTHPAVAECAVVGRQNADGLVESVACVVPRPGAETDAPPTAEALRAHVAAQLAAFKVPRHVEFHATLPHTPTGKIRRALLRQPGTAERTA